MYKVSKMTDIMFSQVRVYDRWYSTPCAVCFPFLPQAPPAHDDLQWSAAETTVTADELRPLLGDEPLGQRVWDLVTSRYMPPRRSGETGIQDDKARLIFLAAICLNRRRPDVQVPMLKSDILALSFARQASKRTETGLTYYSAIFAFGACAVTGALGVVMPFTGCPLAVVLPVSVGSGMLSSLGSAYFGWWTTGTYPDQSSTAKDRRQDSIDRLSAEFRLMGKTLMYMTRVHAAQAAALAHTIHIARLAEIIGREICLEHGVMDVDATHHILDEFAETVRFIRSNGRETSLFVSEFVSNVSDPQIMSIAMRPLLDYRHLRPAAADD